MIISMALAQIWRIDGPTSAVLLGDLAQAWDLALTLPPFHGIAQTPA